MTEETTAAEPRMGLSYWKLFAATTISNFGDGVSTVAYVWLASAVTRNPLQLSLVAVAVTIPRLLFTLPAGAITDRVDRKRLVGWTNVFMFALTLTVAIIVFLGRGDLADPAALAAGEVPPPANAIWYLVMLYITSILFGSAEVLRDNASHTLIPSLVDRRLLDRANGRMWASEQVMNSLVGPPLGGVLIAVAFALPFFIDAGTFAVAAALVFLIAGKYRAARSDVAEGAKPRWTADVAEGVRWLWRHTLLRDLAIVLGVMNMMNIVAFATYVFFAQEILGLSAGQFGLLMTGGAVGGVIGSWTAERVAKRLGSGGALYLVIFMGVTAFAVTGLTSNAIVVWFMMATFSAGALIWNVITMTLRQAIVPDQLLGRVMSVYRLLGLGLMPIGGLLGGGLVAVFELFVDRSLALRMPFFATAIVYGLLLPVAAPRLTTAKIRAAEEEAVIENPDSE